MLRAVFFLHLGSGQIAYNIDVGGAGGFNMTHDGTAFISLAPDTHVRTSRCVPLDMRRVP